MPETKNESVSGPPFVTRCRHAAFDDYRQGLKADGFIDGEVVVTFSLGVDCPFDSYDEAIKAVRQALDRRERCTIDVVMSRQGAGTIRNRLSIGGRGPRRTSELVIVASSSSWEAAGDLLRTAKMVIADAQRRSRSRFWMGRRVAMRRVLLAFSVPIVSGLLLKACFG